MERDVCVVCEGIVCVGVWVGVKFGKGILVVCS